VAVSSDPDGRHLEISENRDISSSGLTDLHEIWLVDNEVTECGKYHLSSDFFLHFLACYSVAVNIVDKLQILYLP